MKGLGNAQTDGTKFKKVQGEIGLLYMVSGWKDLRKFQESQISSRIDYQNNQELCAKSMKLQIQVTWCQQSFREVRGSNKWNKF